MLSCNDVLIELNNYVDGEIAPNLRAALQEHLSQCRNCRVLVDTTSKTVHIVSELASLELPAGLSERLLAKLPEAAEQASAGYLRSPQPPEDFAPYVALRRRFGFVPNMFLAQGLRPDLIQAEVNLDLAVLTEESALSRWQKEAIALVCSSARLNTYCVTMHCEFMRLMGVSDPEMEQLAADHHYADISEADEALLDFVLKLTGEPYRVEHQDIERLRQHGFRDEQILEAVVLTALVNFFNLISLGLGTAPEFKTPEWFRGKT